MSRKGLNHQKLQWYNTDIKSSHHHPLVVGPALAHLNSLLPAAESACGLVVGDLRLEQCLALGVDIVQVAEVLPDSNSQTGSDGGTKGGSLAHSWAADRDTDKISLGLEVTQLASHSSLNH